VTTTAAAEPDRNDVAALLARGRAILSNGDVAGARAFLRRAAEHNDPQAALALGETYDPVVLKRLGVIKFNSDVAQAREWYRRAADLGSAAAGSRLGQLSNGDQ
jgi:TPR repeat protein